MIKNDVIILQKRRVNVYKLALSTKTILENCIGTKIRQF